MWGPSELPAQRAGGHPQQEGPGGALSASPGRSPLQCSSATGVFPVSSAPSSCEPPKLKRSAPATRFGAVGQKDPAGSRAAVMPSRGGHGDSGSDDGAPCGLTVALLTMKGPATNLLLKLKNAHVLCNRRSGRSQNP